LYGRKFGDIPEDDAMAGVSLVDKSRLHGTMEKSV